MGLGFVIFFLENFNNFVYRFPSLNSMAIGGPQQDINRREQKTPEIWCCFTIANQWKKKKQVWKQFLFNLPSMKFFLCTHKGKLVVECIIDVTHRHALGAPPLKHFRIDCLLSLSDINQKSYGCYQHKTTTPESTPFIQLSYFYLNRI